MSNWEGQPKTQANHRTLGGRAWCSECREYCYPVDNCPCCMEALGWQQVWLRPDGAIVDWNGETIGRKLP